MPLTKMNIAWSAVQALILMIVMWVWFGNACPNYPSGDGKGSPDLKLQCRYGTGFTAGALAVMAIVLFAIAGALPLSS